METLNERNPEPQNDAGFLAAVTGLAVVVCGFMSVGSLAAARDAEAGPTFGVWLAMACGAGYAAWSLVTGYRSAWLDRRDAGRGVRQ